MKIVIGADHRGYVHKEYIKKVLLEFEWCDVGTHTTERTDYPIFAQKAVDLLQSAQAECGVLLCGSGAGMAIAVNRHPHMYAAVVWNTESARRAKEDDNGTVLVLPTDFISPEESIECIGAWLGASFKKGRYQERLNMIDQ